jgi:hypothetical protein
LKHEIDINAEFNTLRELRDFLNNLSEETLDKNLVNDGYRDRLTLYEDVDNKTVYYM